MVMHINLAGRARSLNSSSFCGAWQASTGISFVLMIFFIHMKQGPRWTSPTIGEAMYQLVRPWIRAACSAWGWLQANTVNCSKSLDHSHAHGNNRLNIVTSTYWNSAWSSFWYDSHTSVCKSCIRMWNVFLFGDQPLLHLSSIQILDHVCLIGPTTLSA